MRQLKKLSRHDVLIRSEESALAAPHFHMPGGALLIAGLAFLIYWPAIHGGFLLDDNLLVAENPLVNAPNGLYRIWFTREPVDYWPVTNSSFWLQWRLWGMNPTGYHVTNLLVHICNALLIWLLLKRLQIPGGFLAALLFAVHPVNVESAAWIAQLKNTLSMLFFLLSLLCYLKSQRDFAPENQQTTSLRGRKNQAPPLTGRWYWLSLASFTLAMLSKGSVAILPLVLLLIVWWQCGRITIRDVWRTAPFFVVAIVLTGVNIWFRTHGSETVIRSADFGQRLAGAGAVIWFYLYKAILPINLEFVYPQWNIQIGNLLWWLPLTGAVVVTACLLYACWKSPQRKWTRHLLLAWGFFCVALIPVLGFVDVGYMKYSLVADHYEYIAMIGLVTLAAAGGYYWHSKLSSWAKTAITICGAGTVVALALLARQQSQLYADSTTLYQATLQKNPSCWFLHSLLALDLTESSQLDDAISHAQEALRLNPDYPQAHTSLGIALAKQGKTQEAIQQYRQAMALDPNSADIYCDLGTVLEMEGKIPEAIENLQHALQINPQLFQAHWFLARALANTDQPQESLAHLQIAAQLRPDLVEVQINLGHLLDSLGRFQEALVRYQQALQLQPDLPEAYHGQALVYAELNRPQEAIAAAEKGLNLARGGGQSELAEQIETWLTSYRTQSGNPRAQ
jgi:tetratricopeptide (TPR) repeat protein